MPNELKPRELTAKQRKFAEAFAVHRNGVKAYREAYGEHKTENHAAVQSFRNLRNPKIYEIIKKHEEDALIRNGITKDRIIQEIAALAFSDITVPASVSIDNLRHLPKEARAAIRKAIRREGLNGYTEELELYPKLPALLALAEIAGLTTKDKAIEINGENVQVVFK